MAMKSVLIIEDCLDIRENISELLELRGYLVFSAANGKIGLEMATNHLPDIILCDVLMPEMNGNLVFSALRSSELTRHIPFLFISSSTEKKDIQLALSKGVNGYIQKPFDDDLLFTTIEDCLRGV
jgi:CheY-like chemotaxis protein